MSRSRGKGQRPRRQQKTTWIGPPYQDGSGFWFRASGWISTITESTRRALGASWHSHLSGRLAERKSKRHAKRNLAAAERRRAKAEIRRETEGEP